MQIISKQDPKFFKKHGITCEFLYPRYLNGAIVGYIEDPFTLTYRVVYSHQELVEIITEHNPKISELSAIYMIKRITYPSTKPSEFTPIILKIEEEILTGIAKRMLIKQASML